MHHSPSAEFNGHDKLDQVARFVGSGLLALFWLLFAVAILGPANGFTGTAATIALGALAIASVVFWFMRTAKADARLFVAAASAVAIALLSLRFRGELPFATEAVLYAVLLSVLTAWCDHRAILAAGGVAAICLAAIPFLAVGSKPAGDATTVLLIVFQTIAMAWLSQAMRRMIREFDEAVQDARASHDAIKAQASDTSAAAVREQERRNTLRGFITEFDTSTLETLDVVVEKLGQIRDTARSLTQISDLATEEVRAVASTTGISSQNLSQVAVATGQLSGAIHQIENQLGTAQLRIRNMNENAASTTATIDQLAGAVAKIGGMVDLILGVAKQTNLLALNATIEAARAGEAGRGFAVVASEVKALALQTAHATSEITAQIGDVQRCTAQAVDGIRDLSTSIHEIDERANTIASAVEEQGRATSVISSSINEIASSTEQLAQTTGKIGASAEQIHNAARTVLSAHEDMGGRVRGLETEVHRFLQKVATA